MIYFLGFDTLSFESLTRYRPSSSDNSEKTYPLSVWVPDIEAFTGAPIEVVPIPFIMTIFLCLIIFYSQ